MPLTDLVLADTPATLDRALALLAEVPILGIDVERADSDRYYRAAALLQIGGEGRAAVIDPLALADLSPLQPLLASRATVFHALENDLEPLGALDLRPPVLCDTAVAAAMLGLPTGLETLLRDLLGVELPGDKAAMQRADWEARPLSEAMVAYAAADVADLPALWATLHERLLASGRLDWYDQELAALLALPSVQARRDWTRTKGAGRLPAAARTRLRAVWAAREDLARSTDTAPGRIAGDAVLVDLATDPPRSAGELGRRGLRRRAARAFGPALLAALASVDAAGDEPDQRRAAPTPADRRAIDELRQLRAERAAALAIDAGVLCPSRTLAGAVLSRPRSPSELRQALGLRAWQWEQVGDAFCDVLGLAGPDRPPSPDHSGSAAQALTAPVLEVEETADG